MCRAGACGDGLHQQLQRFVKSSCSSRFPFVVTKAHNNEIVGWHDHRYLPASARHVIGLSWDGVLAKPVDPKKSAVDWKFVGHPSWRWCADEFHITFGQKAFSVPDTILEIKIAEPRPIAAAPNFVALSQEISEWPLGDGCQRRRREA